MDLIDRRASSSRDVVILVSPVRSEGREICRSEVDEQFFNSDKVLGGERRSGHLEEGQLLADLINNGEMKLASRVLDQSLEGIIGELHKSGL